MQQEKQFFGHPRALGNLFHVELWERFSYYGMQAILLFYMYYAMTDGGLGMDKAIAGGIMGAYSGSIYVATLGAGWIADRVLGAERTLFYSGMVIMAGHIVLAIVPGLEGLIFGLILVALGSGGVKAPVSSMVGSLYDNDQYRHLRDSGFSLFYVSINIGAFLGPLITGLLQNKVGFHYGFGAAAVGMGFGLFQYSLGRKLLVQHQSAPNPLNPQEKKQALIGLGMGVLVLVAVIASGFITLTNFKMVLFYSVLAIACLYFARLLTDKRVDSVKKGHILAYIPLFVCICIFWALFFQNFTALMIYFESTVNRMFGSFEFPEAWQPSMQSFWVIALAGAMSALWRKLGKNAPSDPVKFALSLIFAALTFVFFIYHIQSGSPMPIWVYMIALGVLTVAELMISPISLSFATKIAPDFFKTQMIALNFLGLSIGLTLGGILFGNFYDEANPLGFYYMILGLGLGAGVIFLLISPILKKMLRDVA
ncbi:peptide MFS transporter [Alysiella filiformis]|uniref:Proton-dependent oligopeptide transporter, POT family n=1 Tax=Alysiella filiformis DSM 16848 TaxID=1120981 RepID=A0A286EG24_9NEIS|nr:oligopeptide:H+ symporter [Alysiella filiformis]QMT31226.1 MFS transporter [Alysiella filiformis]UBQ55774.1 oligopeptide:H+ symporter [Alysiella filiformis DSM 16848]SOD69858.1 proton-dependent oligopeptide transporter, POT family [Alysiella filiformis DSM 16848]